MSNFSTDGYGNPVKVKQNSLDINFWIKHKETPKDAKPGKTKSSSKVQQ